MEFYILGSKENRISSKKTIFADGSADKTFRENIDIELSHWVPNKTPKKYKYDTSTEICINFAKNENLEDYDLVINNHLDVDGILCVFSLIYSEYAIKNEAIISEAAKMGDFWFYGNKDAQILFQGLTLYMNSFEGNKIEEDILSIYKKCFEKVFELIETKNIKDFDIFEGINDLEKSINLIESNKIERYMLNERFVNYNIPKNISKDNLEKCLNITSFNQKLDNSSLLLPQARNSKDFEKVQLVSIESDNGYYYDLFYPSYVWAETPNLWRPQGLKITESTNLYYYGFDKLNNALEILNNKEKNKGKWVIVEKLTPFSTIKGRGFPVVLSFIHDFKPLESSIYREDVIEILSNIFN